MAAPDLAGQRPVGDVDAVREAELAQNVEARAVGAAGDDHAPGACGPRHQREALADGARP